MESRRVPHRDQEPNIHVMSLNRLREAIRSNSISFPAQVPVFEKHDRPDLQQKLVQLYFVLGWSCMDIAARYGLIRQRVQQILNTWKRRAVDMGYVQHIPSAEAVDRGAFGTLAETEGLPQHEANPSMQYHCSNS